MASGDNMDGIELAETSINMKSDERKGIKEVDDDGEKEEKGKASTLPPVDMAAAAATNASGGPKTPTGITRHKSERERKIGHRRVGVGGEITYKKVSKIFESLMCFGLTSWVFKIGNSKLRFLLSLGSLHQCSNSETFNSFEIRHYRPSLHRVCAHRPARSSRAEYWYWERSVYERRGIVVQYIQCKLSQK
ncbi:hypothetical protein C0J52_03142 [Blattella germanica]|nr:hypothetical protein C0J52_03142 [Blattella germanica]